LQKETFIIEISCLSERVGIHTDIGVVEFALVGMRPGQRLVHCNGANTLHLMIFSILKLLNFQLDKSSALKFLLLMSWVHIQSVL